MSDSESEPEFEIVNTKQIYDKLTGGKYTRNKSRKGGIEPNDILKYIYNINDI